MNFDEIFAAYYFQYRAEEDTPPSTDPEYIVAKGLANEAINRWSNYDGVYWKELFTTLQIAGDGDLTVASGITEYETPGDMQEAGGFIKIKNDQGQTVRNIPIIEPQEAQFKGDKSTYAYFTGDPNNGFTLNLNPTPDAAIDGLSIDYVYYKQPTTFTTGTDVTEMSNPYFIVHRILANRFRASMNPHYNDALRDAENALGQMKMNNDSGNWADPWKLADNSSGRFGV